MAPSAKEQDIARQEARKAAKEAAQKLADEKEVRRKAALVEWHAKNKAGRERKAKRKEEERAKKTAAFEARRAAIAKEADEAEAAVKAESDRKACRRPPPSLSPRGSVQICRKFRTWNLTDLLQPFCYRTPPQAAEAVERKVKLKEQFDALQVGLGRIVASSRRPSTSYKIR
jgi:hypothetical protein